MYTAQREQELGTLNIIGCGKLGSSMAALWASAGVMRIGCVSNSTQASAEQAVSELGAGVASASIDQMTPAAIWMIATPDNDIQGVAEQLVSADSLRAGDIVFHCSGALSSQLLRCVTGIGSHVASLHPVRSFARKGLTGEDFQGTFCALEGDPIAVDLLRQACLALGARVFTIEADAKPLCHAGHVFASNYIVAVAHVAEQLYRAAGLPDALARDLMEPLVRSAVMNVGSCGTQAALTGPVVRGDIAVLKEHITAMGQLSPELSELYGSLGRVALQIAELKGELSQERLKQVASILTAPLGSETKT